MASFAEFSMALGPLEFDFSLLQFCDVGVNGNGAAVRSLSFADADPAFAEATLVDEAPRILLDAQPLRNPFLRRRALKVDAPARQASFQKILKALPRKSSSLIIGKDLAVFAVGKKDLVLRIEQDKSVRNRLECCCDRPSLPFRLIFQSLLFNCAGPKKPKRPRHRAELVPSLCLYFDVIAPFRQISDHSVQPPQRADDRAKNKDGEKRPDQHHDGHQNGSCSRRFLGFRYDLVASGFCLGARSFDEFVKGGIHICAVGSRLGEEGVADDAVVLSIAVCRL